MGTHGNHTSLRTWGRAVLCPSLMGEMSGQTSSLSRLTAPGHVDGAAHKMPGAPLLASTATATTRQQKLSEGPERHQS